VIQFDRVVGYLPSGSSRLCSPLATNSEGKLANYVQQVLASRTRLAPEPFALVPHPKSFLETPEQPPSVDPKTEVVAFLREFWNENANNDPGEWASDFAVQSRYCYSNNAWTNRGLY
jgi:hypothetical protein